MSLAERFSGNFQKALKRSGFTQEGLAMKAGYSVSYVSMLSRGQRSPPLDTLEKLATALNVAPTSLLR
jgi:transcriptional regulator with XRE-family HTH domain